MTTEAISKFQKAYAWAIPLFILMAVTFYVYLPGTLGLFIFDDFPNISSVGHYTNLGYWDNFWLYILEGESGPTGRPISLASFYFNAPHWPAKPSSFIYTNIVIHLINGLLIFWLSTKLSKLIHLLPTQQLFFSLLASAIWLLHPMHTTTVLYIVQRMTELSATFILVGILFYLYGRDELSRNKIKAMLLLFVGVGISLLFSILSKENGILLVAYILVIEFFLLQPLKHLPPEKLYYWLVPAIILPFLGVIIYLGIHTDPDAYVNRNFTLAERLLSEPRIIFDYLHHILLPEIGANTIFHDDYNVSKSLLSPWSTLVSIIGIIGLILIAFLVRKTHTLVAFSIAWFFAGHLIESTVLPLELYFEHRNYLPILGVMMAIAYYASTFYITHKTSIIATSAISLSLFAFLVLQNATLWGKPVDQAHYWYKSHPNSLRTLEAFRPFATLHGVTLDQIDTLSSQQQESSLFYSTGSLLTLSRKCSSHHISTQDLDTASQILQSHVIHASTSLGLRSFMKAWQAGACDNLAFTDIKGFLLKLQSLENTQMKHGFLYTIHYYLSEIYRENNDFNQTMTHLDKAYQYKPNYDLLKKRASTLASAGLFNEALQVLSDTDKLTQGLRKRIAMSIKKKELNQLKALLLSKIESTKSLLSKSK